MKEKENRLNMFVSIRAVNPLLLNVSSRTITCDTSTEKLSLTATLQSAARSLFLFFSTSLHLHPSQIQSITFTDSFERYLSLRPKLSHYKIKWKDEDKMTLRGSCVPYKAFVLQLKCPWARRRFTAAFALLCQSVSSTPPRQHCRRYLTHKNTGITFADWKRNVNL